jgi:hypothetical protein
MIRDADIFQLLWSSNAMRSDYVRQEYEYALSLGRPEFVRPTYWEHPLPQDAAAGLPPEELRALHFQQFAVSSLGGSTEKDSAAEVAPDGLDLAAAQRWQAEAAHRARLEAEWAEAERRREAAGGATTLPLPEATVVRPEEPVEPRGIRCAACGTQNDLSRVFCRNCGNELWPTSPRPDPAPVGASRPMSLLPMLLLIGLLLLGILGTVAFFSQPPS